jgi:TPR repeat protein
MGCGTSTLDICRAADRGDAWAQYRLGEIYANGTGGMDKDEVRAVRMYRLAAEQGNDWAQFRLGEFYANGTGGLAKDEVEAVRLYSLAAEQGNDWAQNRLGDHYADGTCGLAMDEVKAVRLFRLAAQQGDRWAQGRLGHFYDEGRGGLVKDEFEAVRLFLLAGEHGVPMLGVHYANGTGGLTKDTGEAAGLFRLAVRRFVTGAGNGNVFAQFKLGEHYANGTCGLAKDKGEAVRLFRLAAEHGHPEAQNKIAALGKHTTQEKGHLTNAHPHTTRAAAVTTATTTALAAPALVDGKQFHCFLTHDWGKDVDSRGRCVALGHCNVTSLSRAPPTVVCSDNHTRVGLVNAGLQARGLKTWFDSDKMEGNVVDRMVRSPPPPRAPLPSRSRPRAPSPVPHTARSLGLVAPPSHARHGLSVLRDRRLGDCSRFCHKAVHRQGGRQG